MSKKHLLLLLAICGTLELFSQGLSAFIHADQFGYLPNASKVAVLSDPQTGFNAGLSYVPPAMLELRDSATNNTVYTAAPVSWNGGATHVQSGDRGWWFDFSTHTTPGTYYVYDGDSNERSAYFKIGPTVYDKVLQAAGRMFYYNRCNMAKLAPYAEPNWTDGNNFVNTLQDANCRYVYDSTNVALEKDLTGGWFDAGDYNKYVTFASRAVHQLLGAYETNPLVFGDNWNIPESGNGLPDLLDELKWELDWLLKMTNPDGSTIIKMGSIDYAENVAAPPSANFDRRYYGPTCTSASIASAGMLARAAIVYANFPSMNAYVASLSTEAEAAWAYVEPFLAGDSLETNCDDGTINSGDADWSISEQREEALLAAIYLFALTGTADYNTYVVNNINDAEPIQTGYWSGYKIGLQEALLYYTTLPGVDTTLANQITNSISTAAANNWNGFYGFNPDDLYRAYMPDWAYHWGSNLPKAGYAILNRLLISYGINPGSHGSYDQKASEQLHFYHGVNPLGLVYLSNMYACDADRCINEIYHTWFADGSDWDNALTSLYGPAPGYVAGGPNQDYNANTNLIPPYNQPHQKSYLDFNDNWPNNSWELSEPAIGYQAFYIRLVSYVASQQAPVSIDNVYGLKGTSTPEGHLLQWTTMDAPSSQQIEIQRSGNGQEWNTIQILPSDAQTYLDAKPLSALNYYQLKRLDENGTWKFSNMVVLQNELQPVLRLFPNPTTAKVAIETGGIPFAVKQITSPEGKTFSNWTLDQGQLDLSALPPGTYFVQLKLSEKLVTRKVVKKKNH